MLAHVPLRVLLLQRLRAQNFPKHFRDLLHRQPALGVLVVQVEGKHTCKKKKR
jgi:hypothetical protein